MPWVNIEPSEEMKALIRAEKREVVARYLERVALPAHERLVKLLTEPEAGSETKPAPRSD